MGTTMKLILDNIIFRKTSGRLLCLSGSEFTDTERSALAVAFFTIIASPTMGTDDPAKAVQLIRDALPNRVQADTTEMVQFHLTLK